MRNFIFSNKFPWRFSRHSVFWVARILFIIVIHSFSDYSKEASFLNNLPGSFKYIPPLILMSDIPFCYAVVYFFIPNFFLKRKYILFAMSLLFISVLLLTISCFYDYEYHHLTPDLWFVTIWDFTMGVVFVGPFTVCGIFLSIKMLKTWYLKEEEKQILLTENANAEIQLLKAQIHPHFLFNTLNNIYSFTLNKSPEAAELVSKLSDTMNYMITDCNTEFIPLQKELKMIADYMGLEQVRYGKRLDVKINITGEYQSKIIIPLLMIPFVENSFKHGTSKMLRDPWIKLFIQADAEILHFTLINNKPVTEVINGKSGIGLENVKKRLELLYPKNHLLLIEQTENTFTVNMQVPIFASSTQPAKQHVYAT
jgi:sensor histidine kinase YesM